MKILPNQTYIVLSVIHLPVLVAIMALVALGVGATALSSKALDSSKSETSVLSDEDDRDDEEDKDDESDDNDSDNKDEDKAKDDDKDSDNNSSGKNEPESENENEAEDDDELDQTKLMYEVKQKNEVEEDDDEKQEVSTVTNADGSVTKTIQETDDGKVETKIYTYDANGKLIKQTEIKADGSIEEEPVDDDDDTNESSETEDDDNDDGNESEFELTFKSGTNTQLSSMVKAKLEQEIKGNSELGTQVNKLELEVKTSQGTMKYEGTALKTEKLFGIFGIEVPVDIVIDPNTGNIVTVNQSFWNKIVDFFSF